MSNTATRLITLIMMLQREPNHKAGDLAAELGVSVRTVQRYIAMLDEMGIPVYAERGPYGGYSLVRGYKMPPLVLSPEEAVAVHLGTSLVGDVWGQLYREAAQGALAKLDNVLPDEQRGEVAWARRSLSASHFHRASQSVVAPHLEKLRRAVREQRRVRVLYRSRGQPQGLERDIDPYALFYRWGWWYFCGYCHLRRALRSFRVDRLVDCMLLEHTFDVPVDFDLQAYLASEPHTQPTVHVRMRLVPEGALLALDDRAMWESCEEQPDGAVIVRFSVPSLQVAARTVLAYGPFAVVLEPEGLRQLVHVHAQAIAEQHAVEH
jgi:predicted DNA-binding transcriptional regulator YafY